MQASGSGTSQVPGHQLNTKPQSHQQRVSTGCWPGAAWAEPCMPRPCTQQPLSSAGAGRGPCGGRGRGTWYLRMSASETERRAYFMASSKCARVMEGTGSGASSSMLSGFSVAPRSRSMSFSMLSRIAYLRSDGAQALREGVQIFAPHAGHACLNLSHCRTPQCCFLCLPLGEVQQPSQVHASMHLRTLCRW